MGAAIPQVQLTEQAAKSSVDTYLALKEKYGNKVAPAMSPGGEIGGFLAAQDVQTLVTTNGFSSTKEWHETLVNVVMAYGVLADGKLTEMDESISKLQGSSQIPDAAKQQLIGILHSARPSDHNMSIVKELMADPEYAAKLADLKK